MSSSSSMYTGGQQERQGRVVDELGVRQRNSRPRDMLDTTMSSVNAASQPHENKTNHDPSLGQAGVRQPPGRPPKKPSHLSSENYGPSSTSNAEGLTYPDLRITRRQDPPNVGRVSSSGNEIYGQNYDQSQDEDSTEDELETQSQQYVPGERAPGYQSKRHRFDVRSPDSNPQTTEVLAEDDTRRYDDNRAKRRRGKKSSRSPSSTPTKDHGSSLIWNILNDCWGLSKFFLKLTGVSYPLWKWLIVLYFVWIAVSYVFMTAYVYTINKLAPVCSMPIFGPSLPFCNIVLEHNSPKAHNVTKMAASQKELTTVLAGVGQNFDLARSMVRNEFAIRDLRIRVGASELERKDELAKELEKLIKKTKETARGLSRYTAQARGTVDTVKSFDDYAIKSLEAVKTQQLQLSGLTEQVRSALSPLGAFQRSVPELTESRVKRLFVVTASRISDKVQALTEASYQLSHELDDISAVLDRIQEIATDELGGIPTRDVLSALWQKLARPGDEQLRHSHSDLLSEIQKFYKKSALVMVETISALSRVDAEMSDFRDGFATPALILDEYPLEVIISLLKASSDRLGKAVAGLEAVEEGDRPAQELIGEIPATMIAHATMV